MASHWRDMSDDELIEEAKTGVRGQGATIEMMRRIAERAQTKTMNRLTWVIAICTILLLVAGTVQIYFQRLALFW